MAGNKINTKAKGKEDKSKANKSVGQNNEDGEDPDFALLRKPILTSITGFGQARKIFDLATEELKTLLSNECDLLYECKVCRNLFRSLANFISHKRVFCKERFNTTVHGHFIKSTSTLNELMKIKNIEEGYQESLKLNDVTDDVDERIPLTKDLTAIIEKIGKKKGVQNCIPEEPQMALQRIPNSSVAMFQDIENEDDKPACMRTQVKELDDMMSKKVAVLQSDGSFKIQSVSSDTDTVIQISDDEDNDDTDVLKCKTCDLQFSTQKTLRFHMKYKHVESRLVYPCPDCLEIFSTSWSVYRHLFKVHRKTAAQIRRLRESIQAKAFRMNNPPAFYEKRKNNMKVAPVPKITEEERLDQENQAWMDNMEGDGEVPRCGGCGRTFERRAALAAHTHTCQPRSRALARRAPPPAPPATPAHADTKRIEIQIRRDYNKGPAATLPPTKPLEIIENDTNKQIQKEDAQTPTKTNKREEKEKTPVDEPRDIEESSMDVSDDDKSSEPESPEKCVDNTRPKIEIYKPIGLPFAQHTEKSNLVALRQKIEVIVDPEKVLCKKCDIVFTEIETLYDHAAEHYKWMRYACKLCNFKHYHFDRLPQHVKEVHKLKGDRDFYFSTVKAISAAEALELCDNVEVNDVNDVSPDSRRPSRCSSDSSRLSDDSSSSSTRIEIGSRKRKMYHNKNTAKKKKENLVKAAEEQGREIEIVTIKDAVIGTDNDSSSNLKTFEENSSDIEEIEDKIPKKQIVKIPTVTSRRPVRRKTKPKNEDFEYDLSNLLKMEAQGYRDSQATTTKPSQPKKRVQQDIQVNYDSINKDCCGALAALSKKSVEVAGAHMKTCFSLFSNLKEPRTSSTFARPMIPKILAKGDKTTSKNDSNDEGKDTSSPIKETNTENDAVKILDTTGKKEDIPHNDKIPIKDKDMDISNSAKLDTSSEACETVKTNLNIPAVVPLKFRRQSLEVIKNPLINKNIKDFTKAGMKTKILVIKPINRSKDGTKTVNTTPLKFQTIKLKDRNKSSTTSAEDKSPDQVVVVKVPKVDCTVARSNTDTSKDANEKSSSAITQNETSTKMSQENSNNAKDPTECPNNTQTEVKDTSSEAVILNDDQDKSNGAIIRPVSECNKESESLVANNNDEESVNKSTDTEVSKSDE